MISKRISEAFVQRVSALRTWECNSNVEELVGGGEEGAASSCQAEQRGAKRKCEEIADSGSANSELLPFYFRKSEKGAASSCQAEQRGPNRNCGETAECVSTNSDLRYFPQDILNHGLLDGATGR